MDNAIIRELVSRYKRLTPNTVYSNHFLVMKIVCAHNAKPLKLEMLLISTDSDLIHDIEGIIEHFNTNTKQYESLFWPRYAAQCSNQCTHTGH